MAQSGYTPISIYYSSTATNIPTAGNLANGELAINIADGKLYYKDSGGTVQVLATKGGVGSSTTTQVLYNSSGLVVGSANMTFDGSTLTTLNSAYTGTLTGGTGIVNLGSGQFYKDASGNIGVGTSSPATKLQVTYADNSFNAGITVVNSTNNTQAQSKINIVNSSGNILALIQNSASINSGVAYVGTSSTQALTLGTGYAEAMRIDSSGNVGIGTSSPSSKLNVAGSNVTVSAGYGIAYSGDQTRIMTPEDNVSGALIRWAGGGICRFLNGTTEKARIDSSGNLLVGTTSSNWAANGHIESTTGYACKAGQIGGFSGNGFNINWTGNPILWIDSTNVGQIATVSDYRLKENVTPQTAAALERIMQLQPVEFNRKAVGIFGGSTDIEEGFIAHELQEIIPSAVTGDKDALTEDGTIQPQSLNWSPVVSVLVKAIQEQQALIENLTTRLTALEGK